jgi:ABC-type amino acid transport substrate-binding protein
MGSKTADGGNRSAPTFLVAIPGNLYARLEKGRPAGIFIEALDVLLRKSGIAPTYINMATRDAIRDLDTGIVSAATVVVPTDMIIGAAYFSEPFVTEYNVAVTLKNKTFNVSKVSDLRGKKIGGRMGYQYPLIEMASDMQLLRFSTDGEMLRALLYGKTDVAIFAGISDIYAFRSEGIMTRMEILKTSVGAVPLVAAFSKKRFSSERVDAFNQALASFKQSPEWQEILERNGLADLVKDWPLVTE